MIDARVTSKREALVEQRPDVAQPRHRRGLSRLYISSLLLPTLCPPACSVGQLLDLLPMSKNADVFVAGFPRTGRAPCCLWRRRPVLLVYLQFRSGALRAVFICRRREWRLQPAASSVTRQCLWGNQPHLHCLVVLNFPVSVFF